MIDHMHIHCETVNNNCGATDLRNIYGVTKSNREDRPGAKFGYFRIQLDANGDPDGSTVYYTPMTGQNTRRAIGIWDRFNGSAIHTIVRQNAKELYYVHLDMGNLFIRQEFFLLGNEFDENRLGASAWLREAEKKEKRGNDRII